MKQGRTGTKILFAVMLVFCLTVGGFIGYLTVGASLQQRSALSLLSEIVIDIAMGGDAYVSEEETLAKIEKRRKKNEAYSVSGVYKTLYGFSTEEYEGFEVCYYGADSAETVVYFHGGSYMWQPLIFHYAYCDYLRDELGVNVIMPVYPKAPQYDYAEVLGWLFSFYAALPDGYEVIAFMGDSAGGGLLLSFSQYLADEGMDVPNDLIVFSPCLDLSLSNPEIASYTALDPMLNWQDLRIKLSYYANGGAFDDPYVSPLYCDYSLLGEVTIFAGTHEILLPDVRLLDEALTAQGISHNYYEYPNQCHTFSIFPIPERRLCLEQIKSALYD